MKMTPWERDHNNGFFHASSRILASAEALSTDEEFTSDEESDFEEMGKNIESMLDNKKTISEV